MRCAFYFIAIKKKRRRREKETTGGADHKLEDIRRERLFYSAVIPDGRGQLLITKFIYCTLLLFSSGGPKLGGEREVGVSSRENEWRLPNECCDDKNITKIGIAL